MDGSMELPKTKELTHSKDSRFCSLNENLYVEICMMTKWSKYQKKSRWMLVYILEKFFKEEKIL